MLRRATLQDLDSIVRIENRCFDADRVSRIRMRYLLLKANSEIWLDEDADAVRGYVMLLYSKRLSLARIYSLAVDPDYQRQGVAARLVEQAEAAARARACSALRLEIRVDNLPSQNLFKRMGYQELARLSAYYTNRVDGIRFEKLLQDEAGPAVARVRHLKPKVDGGCGSSVRAASVGRANLL